jgi:hypothetical protein
MKRHENLSQLLGVCSLGLALLFVSSASLALPVTGLYSEQVAVANESDAERSRAFREALQAVILRVTGAPQWLDHPTIIAAVENAQSYVEAIGYSSEFVAVPAEAAALAAQTTDLTGTTETTGTTEATETTETTEITQTPGAAVEPTVATPEPDANQAEVSAPLIPTTIPTTREQRYIDVDFSSALIDELLTTANIPIWDSNRPSVLVWMALQDETGNRSLMTADINNDIIELIQEFADRRGLPVLFPVLDFEDRRSLNEDLVWTLNEEAIRKASSRYGADSILTGRLHFTASGELVGLWQFLFQDEADVFDGFSTDLREYLHGPLARVTSQLASYFAIVPESATREMVQLRIDGVGSLQEYSSLLSYVSGLGLVESVSPAQLDGERLELRLGLVGDAQQLFELIALDRDLLPIEGGASDASDVLHYRWTR